MTSFFSPTELDKFVKQSLAEDDHLTHVVVGTVDETGAQVVVSFKKVDSFWELQAAARHNWSGEDTFGAKVILKW